MIVLGVLISFVDIPIAYMLQKLIPDDYRGRVLSIGISVGKIILPLALILSGALMNLTPSYIVPIAGGIIFLIINLLLIKK
jgi:predicted tellurium resistance membrane protein TerC